MEETTVVIVGAGPSGLALGALLGRMNVKTIILEKDTEVCEDPRGIVVNGDAVRISYQIGIGEGLTKRIGKDISVLNFHRGNFRQSPFMTFDIRDGAKHLIRTSWLVGADGKRGVVRKKFLEPEGVRQVEGEWTYVGTWVAANLKITTPTPESHPEFPLWKLGYTPQQVHDTFWPTGFYFCNDDKRPQVSGRFGPAGSGFWRHEYSVEPEDNLDDVQGHLWKIFGSWMIIPGSKLSRTLAKTVVEFPRDCIDVIRCRPFTFTVKVVNKWFVRNTMLIGDAAHVFPPFGRQGIACRIRDAQSLAWRLAMMSTISVLTTTRERILEGWSQERRHAWKGAMNATRLNGSIVNMWSFFGGLLYRIVMRLVWQFPILARLRTHRAFRDKLAFTHKTCPDGFFLDGAGVGGRKVAQIRVRKQGQAPILSDSAFLRNLSHLSLLVFVRRDSPAVEHAQIAEILKVADLPRDMLTMEDVTLYFIDGSSSETSTARPEPGLEAYYPCTTEELAGEGITPIKGYHHTSVEDRYGSSAKFVLVRPDFIVHSVASSGEELLANLGKTGEYFR
ncbi:hypothetical protein B0T24DRAFT_697177 [Lasiosphaeria ovina]|uniref:FAD-binding domain-containing protein n=1 Tax=Lasiosphaeria ovina TaxID=92902 RepID=A0AAE0NFN4_9PEZI|nr:hypothetical protein B0T24DRAFT_697177 [Lasiosphaeria ovina]